MVVSWDDAAATRRAIGSILVQTVSAQEVIVVDNHPDHPVASNPASSMGTRVVEAETNLGFAGGAARGMRETQADWVLFLNPDAVAAPDCIEHLLEAASERAGVIGAQVLLPDGRVNAGDNPVHITGITWAGRLGDPPDEGPPRAVASVSGAAMLVRRTAYEAVGGMSEEYFLYHEDVDLAWRMRLAGWDVVFQPAALVEHDYSFDKGPEKWFYLERNRLMTVLTCYSASTLLLLAPVLLATEVVTALLARQDGWWPQKRRAWAAVWSGRTRIRRKHRATQSLRRIPDGEILRLMTGRFDSPLVSAPGVTHATAPLEALRRVLVRTLS